MKKLITLNLYKEKRLEKSYKDINAIVDNDSYIFMLEGVKTSINNTVFTRETKEYKFTLDIKKKEATYLLVDKNMLFDIDVEKINFQNKKNNIILEYKLSSDDENFKIEIIVKDESK